MITIFFSKSRPYNYILIIILLCLCSFYNLNSQIKNVLPTQSAYINVIGLLLLILSMFLSNFISKKNVLIKNNSYIFLFFFSFLILLPCSLLNINVIIANFFILLAIRRLISLQSLISVKEKIFDAALLIFVASLFHFWCILYILLVFFSIILHASRDYRNWILPYIALFAVTIMSTLTATVFDLPLKAYVFQQMNIDLKFNYFTTIYQNIALSIFAAIVVLFFSNTIITLSNKPLTTQSSFKKVTLCLLIGVVVFIISPAKSNSYLLFTFMPVSTMAAAYFENETTRWKGEATAIIIIGLSALLYFMQF